MGKYSSAAWLIACVLVIALTAILVYPVLNGGFNDDWAYVRMAQRYAATGHITYDGWTQPMGVPLTILGGAVIRLFGFSYLALRLAVLPFWIGSAVLVWMLGRRIGLTPALASLVSLSAALSPTAVPLGVSFSTDMPATMLTLLAAWCALRGAQSEHANRSLGWLGAAAAAGILAGMNREIFWAAAPGMIAAVACLRWRDGNFRAGALAILAAAVAISAVALKWHTAQPGIRPNTLELVNAHGWGIPKKLAQETIQIGRTALLLMLPVLVLFLAGAAALRRNVLLGAGAFTALCGALALYRPHLMEAPWLGNLFTAFGPLYPSEDTWGSKPMVIPPAVQILLGLLVCASAAAAAGFLGQYLYDRRHSIRGALAAGWHRRSPILVLALACLPFLLAYAGVLVVRSLTFSNFDRYVAAVIAFPALLAAWFWQKSSIRIPATAGWVVAALFAAFGAATTHDLFATDRARLAAANWVTGQDIPRRCLTAGYEYDGDTQLLAQGTLIDDPSPALKSRPIGFWFFEWTPAIDPCQYVVLSRDPKLGPVESQISYTAWLPPHRRNVLVQRGPQACPASCQRDSRRASVIP